MKTRNQTSWTDARSFFFSSDRRVDGLGIRSVVLGSFCLACLLACDSTVFAQNTTLSRPTGKVVGSNLVQSQPLAQSAAVKSWIARQAEVQSSAAKVLPAVVAISDGQSFGSGVVVSKDGLILTAGHVIIEPDRDFSVWFPDGRMVSAKPLGKNLNADAGMIKLSESADGGWPFVDIGTEGSVGLGDWVIALGHSGGYDLGRTPPVRLGRILRRDRDAFTSDCSIIGGDSGGPLFNLQGQLIGIHSSIGDSIAENRHVSIGMFLRDWDRLESGESWGMLPGTEKPKRRERSKPEPKADDTKPRQPGSDDKVGPPENVGPSSNQGTAALGVDVDRSDRRAIIRDIKSNSAAERVGLKVGDIIVSLDGVAVDSPMGLVRQIANRRAGESVKVQIERSGQKLEYQIILGEL